jgi:rhamnulokinase
MKNAFIAADFGGGSGRVIAGSVTGGQLHLDEIHRFTNRPVKLGDTVYWDFPSLFADLKEGLAKAVKAGYHILSVGIDTWGVDFGLIDSKGHLMSNPVCYRDEATLPYPEKFFATHPATEHYAVNGTQVMPINTLFRLLSIKDSAPWMLENAQSLLFTPDLFTYFLTGVAVNEYCIASTSELLNASTRSWDTPLIRDCGLPEHIFGKIVMPGSITGYIKEDILHEIGADYQIPVVAVGSHDTASAVFAIEKFADGNAFLSCGTWSLLGAVIDQPVLTEKARLGGFTNEGAVGGKIRLLQNITGLWILQRLIDKWQKEGLFTDYPTLLAQAEKSTCNTIIDVDDPSFATAFDMAQAIQRYCADHSLDTPRTPADYMMCICRSLAARYSKGIKALNDVLPSPVKSLVIMGGGGKNHLLVKLTAEATGLDVIVGPAEATAIGNILMQAKTAGCDNFNYH